MKIVRRGVVRDCKYTDEARRATTSSGVKPASAIRARIESTVSNGSGTVPSGAGNEASWGER
jgi:hypothetical protein